MEEVFFKFLKKMGGRDFILENGTSHFLINGNHFSQAKAVKRMKDMAKDDYNVIVLYILNYLYNCVRHGEEVDPDKVFLSEYPANIEFSYIEFILRQLYNKGFIAGINVIDSTDKTSKHREYQILNIEEIEITADGINYLQNDSIMTETWNKVVAAGGLIFSAIQAFQ